MMNLRCPGCGADIVLKSSISVFAVCAYCRSTSVRQDINLEQLGKMAQLPPDMSPLRIGTQGTYESKRFELVGRLKVGWAQGSWNEWFALFEDGKSGWISVAQGFYMISFAKEDLKGVPPIEALLPGSEWELIDKQIFQIDDIKKAVCIGSEGELPFLGPQGRQSISVDLSGPNHQFATIDYANDGVYLYIGKYVDFDDFHFTSLRQIDGW